MEQDSLIKRLLGNSVENNNRLVLTVMVILVALIIPSTSYLKYRGWTTRFISQLDILQAAVISAGILLILYIVILRFGRRNWTKWLSISSAFLVFLVFRIPSYHAGETQALFYLTIVLAIFYYDYLLVLYATILCIGGDFLLQVYFAGHIPDETLAMALGIRYMNYFWVGIAACLGTRAMRSLLLLSTQLKGEIDRLQEDIERERKLERLRKDFMAAVSHELKTPLALVQGYAEAVRDGLKPQKNKEYMGIIIDEVQSIGSLITNMLELTQFENGHVNLDWQEFDLEGLVQRLVDRYQPVWAGKNMTIRLERSGQDFLVGGDEMQIEHCAANLLYNAVQHSPDSGHIDIELIEYPSEVFFSVENQRDPLSDEEMMKIWLPFYRTEKSRSKEFGGTGLGLTIAQNIFQLHGASYGVENTESGVRFHFSLKKG